MQKIKEEQIQRRESAEDAARHHQQEDIKLLLPRLNFPRAKRGRKGDDGSHQNQADIQSIHTDVVADAQRGDPGNLIHETVSVPVRDGAAVGTKHFNRQHGGNERGEHGNGADDDAIIPRHHDQCQRRQQRPACDVSQNGHFIFRERNRAARPRRPRKERRTPANCRFAPGATRDR